MRPLKRSGGRRYYRPNDVAELSKIRDLLYKDGFTIKGAQRLLKSKKALDSTGVLADAADNVGASDLAAIRAILVSARERLASVKNQLDR